MMQSLWHLLLWLLSITIFFADTQVTLLFVGPRTQPAVRQEWAAVILLFPFLALLVTPLWAWAAGAVCLGLSLHLLGHLLGCRRLEATLAPAPPAVVERVQALAAQWGLPTPVAIRLDPTDRMEPAVVGLLRPRLILTPLVLGLPEPGFRAVVAHELAHVRHGDPLRLWAAGLARSLLGWHPLAHRAVDHLTLEVEMAADRQAVAWTGELRAYALALGRWGLRRADASQNRFGVALTGASSHLAHRLTSLVEADCPAPHLTRPAWLPGGRNRAPVPFGLRWFHLVLGAAYTVVYLLLARQL